MPHTPGPWQLEDSTIFRQAENCIATVLGGNGKQYLEDDVNAECVANAKLIAAAPDLLEALQSLLKVVERTPQAMEGFNMISVERSRIAIRKAIG